ncbi:MAG TPA: hypothetical protein VKA68_18295, partial [bacterium]|nr:hypothetical protein [bacterium]
MVTLATHLILLIFVKSTVILLLAWTVTSLLRKQVSANIRVSIWMAALLGLMFMPVLSGTLPPFTVNIPQTIATPVLSPDPVLEQQESVRPDAAAVESVGTGDSGTGSRSRASAPESSTGSGTLWEGFGEIVSGSQILAYAGMGLWLIGVLAIIGRL